MEYRFTVHTTTQSHLHTSDSYNKIMDQEYFESAYLCQNPTPSILLMGALMKKGNLYKTCQDPEGYPHDYQSQIIWLSVKPVLCPANSLVTLSGISRFMSLFRTNKAEMGFSLLARAAKPSEKQIVQSPETQKKRKNVIPISMSHARACA